MTKRFHLLYIPNYNVVSVERENNSVRNHREIISDVLIITLFVLIMFDRWSSKSVRRLGWVILLKIRLYFYAKKKLSEATFIGC